MSKKDNDDFDFNLDDDTEETSMTPFGGFREDDVRAGGEENDFTVPIKSNTHIVADKKTTSKVMIVGVIIAIVAVVVVLLFLRAVKNSDQSSKSPKETPTQKVEQTQGAQVTPGNTTPNQQKNPGHSDENWVAISDSQVNDVSDKKDGVFTVTSVEHYVRSGSSGYQIRSVVRGNISGLKGEYEIYLNFSMASKLKEGLTFDVKYTTVEDKGNMFLVEIWWE